MITVKSGNAEVLSITVNDALAKSNKELGLNRATLAFRYKSEKASENNKAQELLQQLSTVNNSFTLLIELGETKLEDVVVSLKGQICQFTTVIAPVSDITNGKAKMLKQKGPNGRTYADMKNSYIGILDNTDAEQAALIARCNRQIERGDLELVPLAGEKPAEKEGKNLLAGE